MTFKKENEFVDSLIKLTKSNIITWVPMRKYLDENSNYEFQDYIVNVLEESYRLSNYRKDYLKLENSFVATINESILFALNLDKKHVLFVQNSIETKIQRTPFSTENNENVKLLLENIENNISSAEFTIQKIIDLARNLNDSTF